MTIEAQTRTGQILIVMTVLAWIAFIGFMIEAGAIMVAYGVIWLNGDWAQRLYPGLDLPSLRAYSFWHYSVSVSFSVTLLIMKSWIAWQVIKTLSKFNLQNPFTPEVAGRLEQISYFALGTWVVTMLNNAHVGWLEKNTEGLELRFLSGEFIYLVGLIFIIAQVFKRGVEIQSENELTI